MFALSVTSAIVEQTHILLKKRAHTHQIARSFPAGTRHQLVKQKKGGPLSPVSKAREHHTQKESRLAETAEGNSDHLDKQLFTLARE